MESLDFSARKKNPLNPPKEWISRGGEHVYPRVSFLNEYLAFIIQVVEETVCFYDVTSRKTQGVADGDGGAVRDNT